MYVHIKFNQFLFPPGETPQNSSFNSLKLWVKLAPNTISQPADCVVSQNTLSCNFQWTFNVGNVQQQKIEVQLKRGNFITGDDVIGSVTLPLTWFQKDSVVRYWYPMRRNNNSNPIFADISVHLATSSITKFSANSGNLLVMPSWQIPVPVQQAPQQASPGYIQQAPPGYVQQAPPGYVQQGPPPGYVQQAPPPGYVQQAPPPGYAQQGPPPGYVQQAPPPGYVQQGPPPGYVQQAPPQGYAPPPPQNVSADVIPHYPQI